MSGTRKDKRKTAPAPKYGEAKYFLVQFIEDNIKAVVVESHIIKEDNGTTKAMYSDKQYYPCVVLSESEDKEQLIKTKNAMDGIAKKKGPPASAQKEKTSKQSGEKKKEKTSATPKGKTKEQKQPGAKEKEEEKQEKPPKPKGKTKEQKEADAKKKEEERKEKLLKKKALDERDLNILSQLTQLNKSVVVIDEHERNLQDKEKELQRKKLELEKKEKEVSKKEKRKNDDLLFANLESIAAGHSVMSDDEDGDDSEEDFNLDDSGVDLSMDIDVQEATSHIRITPGTFTSDRPTVGMKRPRAHLRSRANKCPRRQTQSDPDCSRCEHLLAEIEELKESNTLLTEHLNQCRLQAANAINQSEAPKPGKVSQALAENHRMIELSPGRRVYVYESHLTKANSRKTPTATACFLMSCFYKDSDLIGKSLTGKNGKECIDKDILESILSYTRKKFPEAYDSNIKIALRNKITSLEAKSKKKAAV